MDRSKMDKKRKNYSAIYNVINYSMYCYTAHLCSQVQAYR